jgi:TonB family protein
MKLATRQGRRESAMDKARLLLLLMLGVAALASGQSATQQAKTPVPALASAAVPFYPRVPQQAHIEGVVRLRISTDGNRVASVEVESGQPMLVQAAKENVKTWQFERHAPTSFETTFRYRIFPTKCDSQCNCEGVEKRTVLLRLPTEAEVSAEELMTCDPASDTVDPKTGNLHLTIPIPTKKQ